jgi:putative membrane protein
MIQEHSAMNEELAGIARQKGVEPPASPDLGSQATGAAIGVLPGETFDSQYINQQISAHQSTLELLQKQAQEGQDPDLKAFAQKYVPVVQHHLDEANRIKGQMQ